MCICKITTVYTANMISTVLYIVVSTNTPPVQADVTQQLLSIGSIKVSDRCTDVSETLI